MPTRRLSLCHIFLLIFLMVTTHISSDVVHAGPARTCERAFEVSGPAKRLELPGVSLADDSGRPKTLRIGHYNVQEFKVEKDKAAFQEVDKPQWAVDLIVHQIRREAPDILFLSEIAGVRSLDILAKRAGNYEAVSFEGNDKYSRVAVLIRRDFASTYKAIVRWSMSTATKSRRSSRGTSWSQSSLILATASRP